MDVDSQDTAAAQDGQRLFWRAAGAGREGLVGVSSPSVRLPMGVDHWILEDPWRKSIALFVLTGPTTSAGGRMDNLPRYRLAVR